MRPRSQDCRLIKYMIEQLLVKLLLFIFRSILLQEKIKLSMVLVIYSIIIAETSLLENFVSYTFDCVLNFWGEINTTLLFYFHKNYSPLKIFPVTLHIWFYS